MPARSVRRFEARGCSLPATPVAVIDRRRLLLAVGVISNPADRYRRDWLRDAFRRFDPPNIAQHYVVGCTMRNASAVRAEAEQHGDLIVTAHPDESAVACIEKSFSWWGLALHAFPRARFLAKTDDDSLNNFANLAAILTNPTLVSRGPGRSEQLLYGGWPQFSSYLPEYNVGCGWSGDAGGAIGNARARRLGGVNTNCRFCVNHPFCYIPWRNPSSTGTPLNNTALRGPYAFATGALQIMSAPLVRRVFDAALTKAWVANASMERRERYPQWSGIKWEQPWWDRWACRSEDGFVGYAVFEAAQAFNLSVDFLSLGGRIGDVFDSVPRLNTQVTYHKLEIGLDRLHHAAEQERKVAQRDTYRRQRQRFMTRVRPLLESLNASSYDPPQEWVCHSVASVNRALQQQQQQQQQPQPPQPPQQQPPLAGGAIAARRRQRSKLSPKELPEGLSRYVVTFVLGLPTAAQGWRLCTQSAADEARLRQAGRVNLRLTGEHADGTGFR